MAQNTAMQEAINKFDNLNPYQGFTAQEVVNILLELLPKERQDIIDGYNQGYRDGENNTEINTTKDVSEFDDANNYFIQTFTLKQKIEAL